jgi:hypothetical protein
MPILAALAIVAAFAGRDGVFVTSGPGDGDGQA